MRNINTNSYRRLFTILRNGMWSKLESNVDVARWQYEKIYDLGMINDGSFSGTLNILEFIYNNKP